MPGDLSKLMLLMWKNWILQLRHPIRTVVEVLCPVIFCALLVQVRSLITPKDHPNITSFTPFDVLDDVEGLNVYQLAYSPEGEFVDSVMLKVSNEFNFTQPPRGFKNSEDLEKFLIQTESNLTLCGVQFDDSLSKATITKLPSNIRIALRFPAELRGYTFYNWKTNLLFEQYQIPGPRNYLENDGGYPPGYNEERFLGVQQKLFEGIMEQIKATNNDIIPKIKMQRYPYPPYVEDPLLQALVSFISLVIMLGFDYTCINTVKAITNEKEKQIKEVLKIMGLPNRLHWLAWFVKSFMMIIVSVILIVVLLKVQWLPNSDVSLFTNSDGFVIFIFLLLYTCTTITFCFMVSSFFARANTAAVIAGILWFVSYVPYMFLQPKYDELSIFDKMAMCLGHNTAMSFGFQFVLMFEGTSEGIQWSNIWSTVTPDDTFVLGHVMIMLIVDAFLYLLVTLYIENIFPGEYGVPLPWYYPFQRSYWFGTTPNSDDYYAAQNGDSKGIYEREPTNLRAGIQIKNLRKVYKNEKVAVRDLTVNMYEGQITALLGHNGAGKTTTMSMLSGMFPPSRGTAIIAGHDICTDMPGVRAKLGLCPQHNILFDDLTVTEHLYFFSKLKGLKKDQIKEETSKYLRILELGDKAKARSSTLSGGMKRKLSIGVALCGNSEVVMLDEPTAGMDPAARRAIWDLLQGEKKGRTILLSTHFMDEADLLGDRIAIMAGGTLQCCGSSFFLKKRYGAGYFLTLEKSAQCKVNLVTNLLCKHIPNIEVDRNIGSELTYRLPEDKLSVFEPMLRELEENGESLGILNYGISITTMEEVFMKVGADHGQEEQQNAFEMNGNGKQDMNGLHDSNGELGFNHQSTEKLDLGNNLLVGLPLIINQFRAMLMKKMYSSLRSWGLTSIQVVLPILFLAIAILMSRSMMTSKNLPELEIKLSSYDSPFTVMNSIPGDEYAASYKDYIQNQLQENVVDIGVLDLSDYVINKTLENTPLFRSRYITGASFSGNEILAWFNNEPFHSPPLTLNLVHNAILRKETKNKHSITIVNQPLPYTMDTKLKQLGQGNNVGFQVAFNIGFSMTFVSAFYILFCVRERVCKAKHLQFVSGANALVFWISSYIWDFVNFFVTSIFIIITLACFQEDGLATPAELGRVFSVLIMFGLSMLPLVYLESFLFSVPSSGFTKTVFIHIFAGIGAFLLVEILKIPSLEIEDVADTLEWIFMFIPHYGVCASLKNLYTQYNIQELCKMSSFDKRCSEDLDFYTWEKNGIARNLFCLAITSVVSFCLLIAVEYRIFIRMFYCLKKENSAPFNVPDEDIDVADERQRIKNMSDYEIKTHNLVLKDFSKYYGKMLAVNKLSVGVKPGECFGLLGVNGAGKTSTFKMLTGDETISYGNAFVNGLSLKTNMKNVHKIIGYCPQFDALLSNLTGRETLTLFCLLRGVRYKNTKYLAEKLAQEFDFSRHIDKKVKEYSGGNKRKLSAAVAMIGDPSVVYLDEPTTGMDPAAKRHLWDALCKLRDEYGKCIILTSHSMEECEALCTRIGIMVNGHFKCLGSTQRLKSRFAEGYTLTVKVNRLENSMDVEQADVTSIDQYIKSEFPSAVLRERYQELLTYYIADTNIPWSRMFGIMERGKSTLNIEDYSLGQCSLEQVFLSFTKYQVTL